LNAVNLNTGEIAWKVPLGVVDALQAKGIPKTGIYNLGGSIVTAGGLVFIAATADHRFRAFDAQTGKELWVTKLEYNGHATPLTYQGKKTKKQFVVIAVGAGGNIGDDASGPITLAAYALFPKGESSPAQAKLQAQLKKIPAGLGGSRPESARLPQLRRNPSLQSPAPHHRRNDLRQLPPAIGKRQEHANCERASVHDLSPVGGESKSRNSENGSPQKGRSGS